MLPIDKMSDSKMQLHNEPTKDKDILLFLINSLLWFLLDLLKYAASVRAQVDSEKKQHAHTIHIGGAIGIAGS